MSAARANMDANEASFRSQSALLSYVLPSACSKALYPPLARALGDQYGLCGPITVPVLLGLSHIDPVHLPDLLST